MIVKVVDNLLFALSISKYIHASKFTSHVFTHCKIYMLYYDHEFDKILNVNFRVYSFYVFVLNPSDVYSHLHV